MKTKISELLECWTALDYKRKYTFKLMEAELISRKEFDEEIKLILIQYKTVSNQIDQAILNIIDSETEKPDESG